MRMALAHDTAPGLALYSAVLAFSSLHRNGLHQQAVQLKISALQYLSASTRGGPLSSAEAAQHVAASMLLGAFEVGCQQIYVPTIKSAAILKDSHIDPTTLRKLRRVAVVYLGRYEYYTGD
jgi:hypothetical protein